jgi:thioredoxin
MDVTTESFERDVIERSHELPVVVDFWAAWCGPCNALGPVLEAEAGKRAGQLELVKIDVDAEQALSARFGIQSIPMVAVFRDGEPVTAFVGAHPARAIAGFLDEVIEKYGLPAGLACT